MAEEDDQRFREIQREYLDFLDDDVSLCNLRVCVLGPSGYVRDVEYSQNPRTQYRRFNALTVELTEHICHETK